MATSDIIALLALAISLVSFWLSYRASRLTKIVAAAEKRTQAHSTLVGVLLEAQELLSTVRAAVAHKRADESLPEGLATIEGQLADVIASIQPRLDWLREKGCDDSVLLEGYKALALEVESRVRHVAPKIRELPVILKAPQ